MNEALWRRWDLSGISAEYVKTGSKAAGGGGGGRAPQAMGPHERGPGTGVDGERIYEGDTCDRLR